MPCNELFVLPINGYGAKVLPEIRAEDAAKAVCSDDFLMRKLSDIPNILAAHFRTAHINTKLRRSERAGDHCDV